MGPRSGRSDHFLLGLSFPLPAHQVEAIADEGYSGAWELSVWPGARAGARLSQPPPGPPQCPVSAPGAVFQPRCPRTGARAAHARDTECGPWCPARAAAPASFSLVTWSLHCGLGTGAVGHPRPWPLTAAVGAGAGERVGWPPRRTGKRCHLGSPPAPGKTHSPQQEDGPRAPRGPGLGRSGGQGQAGE